MSTLLIMSLQGGKYLHPNFESYIDIEQVPIIIGGVSSILTKPTQNHGRSFTDDKHEFVKNGDKTFEDEFGNKYPAISIKGVDYSNPTLQKDPSDTSGYRIYGLMDKAYFKRCKRASFVLRSAGVLCEIPLAHHSPSRHVINGQKGVESFSAVGLLSFKEFIYNRYLEQEKPTTAQAYAAGIRVADFYPGAYYRGMLSNYRLDDLKYMSTEEAANKTEEAKKSLYERLSIIKDKDKLLETVMELWSLHLDDNDFYFGTVLPFVMGRNVAFMHNSSVWHKFLHPGNWTICGEIVDLDSVQGPGVYEEDDRITSENKKRDLDHSINSLIKLSSADKSITKSSISMFFNAYEHFSKLDNEEESTVFLSFVRSASQVVSGIIDTKLFSCLGIEAKERYIIDALYSFSQNQKVHSEEEFLFANIALPDKSTFKIEIPRKTISMLVEDFMKILNENNLSIKKSFLTKMATQEITGVYYNTLLTILDLQMEAKVNRSGKQVGPE